MTKHHPHDYLPAAQHDALLPTYDLMSRVFGIGRVHQLLVEQAELAGSHRVLEIGSGTGTLSVRAKRSCPGADVTGVDPDPLALSRAQRKVNGQSGIHFDRGYAQRLPYADDGFDRVLSSLMLHHLDSDAKTAAMAEVFRVLRPGGRLHLVDVDPDEDGRHGPVGRFFARHQHSAAHFDDSIPDLLHRAGFEWTLVGSRRQRVIGRLAFYRAIRPV